MKTKNCADLILKPDGRIQWIDTLPFDLDMGPVNKRRVSRIIPTNPLKKGMFLLLRAVLGDEGRVAAWTRTWAGPWKCRIFATGETAVFDTRENALGWEVDKVNGYLPNFDL